MNRISLLIVLLVTHAVFAEPTKLKVHEERTPGGRLVKSYQYFEREGSKIKHGLTSNYYGDGSLMGSGSYHEGKMHGPWISYYKWIGKKRTQYHYKHGKFDGPHKTWTPNGDLLYESTWKDGKPWNGIACQSGTSSSGFTSETVKDKTFRYKGGSKVSGSKKIFTTVCTRPDSAYPLPVFSEFLSWKYYQYSIRSEYAYLKRLPELEKVPELIDWCLQQKDSHDVAHSQLVALTRVDFLHMDTKKKPSQWKNWWKKVGSNYKKMKPVKGEITSKAWDIVRKNRQLPQPKYSIYLPARYTIHFSFRSGGMSKITEKIILNRTAQTASLTREYSSKENGAIIKEEWSVYSTDDADTTAAAIAYMIDHPWLLNDETAINENFIQELKSGKGVSMRYSPNKKIQGRESFNLYYATSGYVMKSGDQIWWNADPASWSGSNPSRFEFASNPLGSTVYPFIVSLYPETQRADANKPGWRTTPIK